MAVKALKLCKEFYIAKISIEYAHRVVGVNRSYQAVAGIPNSFQVAGGNIATDTGYSEIFRQKCPLYVRSLPELLSNMRVKYRSSTLADARFIRVYELSRTGFS